MIRCSRAALAAALVCALPAGAAMAQTDARATMAAPPDFLRVVIRTLEENGCRMPDTHLAEKVAQAGVSAEDYHMAKRIMVDAEAIGPGFDGEVVLIGVGGCP